MSSRSTDRDWEKLGTADPYWAVLSHGAYRVNALDAEHLHEFLQTGEDHVESIWRTCRRLFGEGFRPKSALDFGCGVGRVALPLSRRVESVTAADVAESMLAVARKLSGESGTDRVRFVTADDTLLSVGGPFDLVHSVLVLQHIPTARGLQLLRRLIELAGQDGVVVVDVLYHNPLQRSRPVRWLHRALRPLRRFRHALPEIQMNTYPLNTVLQSIHESGARQIHVELASHAGHLVATLFFRKNPSG